MKKTGETQPPAMKNAGTGNHAVTAVSRFTFRKVEFSYAGRTYSFSPTGVFLLCLLVGVIGGIYGIGGGAIIAPFFVAIFKLPVYAIAGAALMGTFITSITGVVTYHVLALLYPTAQVAPDWLLGLLFGAGGFLGIYLGARCQKFVPALFIKIILSACILFVAMKYVAGFFL